MSVESVKNAITDRLDSTKTVALKYSILTVITGGWLLFTDDDKYT